jgi:hypothetical protein
MLRNSSTYVYLAVALGLLCYLVFIDKKIPGTQEEQDSETQIFKLDPDEVTGLEITNLHGQFIFQKNVNHWEIRKPVETPADSSTIDGILNQIAYAQPQQIIKIDGSDKDMANLKEWGLTPPAERAVIHTPLISYELLIGRKIPINDSVYARASGKKNESVRVIPSTVKDVLEKDLSEFRSRNVFDFDINDVNYIASRTVDTATAPGQQCEIDLKGNAVWILQMPLVARASTAAVQSLLNKILALRVVDFVSDDATNLSPYGLTTPSASLTVRFQSKGEMVLQIGGPVPNKPDQVYAQRLKSNSVFTLTKASVDELLQALPNVRDRVIFPFDPSQATELSYSFAKKKADVAKDKGLWTTVVQYEGSADAGKIHDILVKISQLETTPVLKDSVTDLKPYGLDKPQGRIALELADIKPPTAYLYIGKDENKLLYVRTSVEPFIYTIPDNALDFLPPDNLALRDPRVVNLKLANVTSMTITAGANPPVTLVRSAGGTWTAANVKDRMVNSLQADTQASLLCQLQAQTWLGPILPAYGLNQPILSIALETGQPKPTILHIGAPLPDGSHAAQIEGDPTAFSISDGDYGRLNASSLQLVPQVLAPASFTNAPPAAPTAPKTNNAPAKP